MKIEIKKTTETIEVIDMKIPFYCKYKDGASFYKILDNYYALKVSNYGNWGSDIGFVGVSVALDDFELIEKEVFEAKFNEVLELITNIKNS